MQHTYPHCAGVGMTEDSRQRHVEQSKVDGKYNFEITIYQKLTTVLDSWCIAYIIPKNVTKQNIILQIEYQSTEL